ncbi:MAG: DNA-3-methyladenine glycosylase [Rhodothermales bacterium]|nr:DNA-3-methyladenine glycosylase [Rhodothermales bacterium]
MKFDKLTAAFFERPTLEVAPDLLGKCLVREGLHDRPMVGKIVETEAYTGDDPAFHAWGIVDPPTGLVQPSGRGYDLFGPPGRSYVYLIYGMYWMLNVLTEREGVAGCVLIRALEPVAGESAMWERRPAAKKPVDLTSGPGKLTQALEIDKSFHRRSLLEAPLYFAEGTSDQSFRVRTSSRIGITRAVDRQWRFYCDGNRFVSPGVPSDIAAENRRKARRRTRRG